MRKILFVLFLVFYFQFFAYGQNIGIGTNTPNTNAILDIRDSSKGVLIPRMDSIHRKSIPNTVGLSVYDTTTNCFWYNNGSSWVNVPPKGTSMGDMLYWNGYQWIILTVGQYGKALFMCNGIPTWGGCQPLIITSAVSNITNVSARSGGNVTNDGGNDVSARGVCWSITINPTIALPTKTSDGSGIGNFVSEVTGLTPNTTYHVRSYATNIIGTTYGNDISFTTTTVFTIGQSYGGGIIFYVDPSGQHGFIASGTDQSTNATWWNGNNVNVQNTSSALGYGVYNTSKIIAAQGNGNYAAKICNNYIGGGYNDWFLPSGGELDELWNQRAVVGGFTTGFYWSSDQRDLSTAYCKYFFDATDTYNSKSAGQYVRAIRAF